MDPRKQIRAVATCPVSAVGILLSVWKVSAAVPALKTEFGVEPLWNIWRRRRTSGRCHPDDSLTIRSLCALHQKPIRGKPLMFAFRQDNIEARFQHSHLLHLWSRCSDNGVPVPCG
ncbi:uncharacterized protein LOC125944887 [Dermacentor silvarum]|uniref:uncharacterized protein LOC125942699 n=1 Tax=Dermacentor silvarum TaxID=543639 RepID=UPI0021007FC7|nr:uncharacterized protein LOC125942699 [Dermacentor silvarum]XP_049519563.1 uncharacterized protein LOC125943979 [Dermacentor silvarum]XP_049522264.1 uncharacterized protein LOC125944887 [Dermacentor silvarum]